MTLEEKLGQMNQLNYNPPAETILEQVRREEIGSLLNVDAKDVNLLQRTATKESRLEIPLIFARA